MEHEDVHAMVYDIMSDAQRKMYEENLECDFSFAVPNLARFRVNAFVQSRGAAAAFRTVPSKVLSLEELNCPKVFAEMTNRPRGLILCTGPTGSGKSTTLAAMVDHVNANEYGHILTIEDPIEFMHESKKCLINQRELGPHTLSFPNALRSALREDPDYILIGEMRDLETIRLALTGGGNGPPRVRDAAHELGRQDDRPDHRRVPRGGKGNGPRHAVGIARVGDRANPAQDQGRPGPPGGARDHDRHAGDPEPDPREQDRADVFGIQTGQNIGMQTLDQCLVEMVRRNMVNVAEARNRAVNKDLFMGK
jgi:twitching motility protein PilT